MRLVQHYIILLFTLLISLKSYEVGGQTRVITPSTIEPLISSNDPTRFCYDNMVTDKNGRFWMKTCGVAQMLYGIRIFQFDGYNRWPISIARDDWQTSKSIYIEGFSSRDQWYGFFNPAEGQSTFFLYDVQTDDIQYVGVPDGVINGVREYEPGKFWILVRYEKDYQIYHWDGKNIELQYSFPNYLSDDPNSFQDGKINFVYSNGSFGILFSHFPLIIFDTKTGSHRTFSTEHLARLAPNSTPAKRLTVEAVKLEAGDSIIYIAQYHASPSFFKINLNKPNSEPEKLWNTPPGSQAQSIWKDEEGNFLFLFEFPRENKKYGAYLLDKNNQLFDYSAMIDQMPIIRSLSGKNFKQSIYVGTTDGAFWVKAKQENSIISHLGLKNLRYILPYKDQQVIVNSKEGYFVIDKNKIAPFQGNSCFQKYSKVSGRKEVLTSPSGKLWLKTLDQLMPVVDKHDDDCNLISLGFRSTTGVFIAESKLALIEETKNKLICYDLNLQEEIKIPGPEINFQGRVHYLWVADNNILWVGTNFGLYKINLHTGESKYFGDTPDFEDHRILSIHEDQQKKLWLGTASRGIHIFNPESEKVELVINDIGGLSNNVVVGMLEDEDGDIWAATYNGLNLLKQDGTIITVFKEEDGLSHNEFNRYSHYKGENGLLYFGALKGLNIIEPRALKKGLLASKNAQIFTTSISYFDAKADETVQLRNYIPNDQPLVLSADKRFLSINVGMSNYGLNRKNRYAYRLEGKQKDWTYLGKEHLIRLTNLPAGKYAILIKGIDQNGNWSANTLRIPIYAKEFFYKQAWFYVVCCIPFLAFAFLWIRRLRSEKFRLEQEVDKRTLEIRKDKELIEYQASELQQLDKMKNRFFANISHDLRTPITLMTGPAELLAEDETIKSSSGLQKSVHSITQNGKKLLRLVDEMLDLARLESNRIKIHEEVVPLFKYCKAIFDTYQFEAQRKQVDFRFDFYPPADYQLLTDPKRLEKILNNLLGNALKFVDTGGAVQFIVSEIKSEIHFKLIDNGRGIPADDIPHIFERFFQSKDASLIQTTGSGIGLALSLEFAKLMNGNLQVESTLGEGSTFTLLLPVKAIDGHAKWQSSVIKPTAIQNEVFSAAPSGKRSRIMVVEDNPEVQGFIRQLLDPEYDVVAFDDGQAALDYLHESAEKELPVQLILSDINMPRLDGYGLIEAIKTNNKWQQLPMIMLTARTREHSKFQALRMGVDDYLTKPFSPIELKVRIANILENYKKRLAYQEVYFEVNPRFEEQPSADQVWLQKLEEHTLYALDQKIDLHANYLAHQMGISERKIARKTKLLTGLTIGKYILEVKLQKARHLLEQETYSTISEVSQYCGFKSPSYFTKVFTDYFGKTPKEYS